MSCLQNELLLESLYEQVVEENPQLSELEAVRLTEQLFEDLIQWMNQNSNLT
jgi:hypothetical protein